VTASIATHLLAGVVGFALALLATMPKRIEE
jgi:hypothetical protein